MTLLMGLGEVQHLFWLLAIVCQGGAGTVYLPGCHVEHRRPWNPGPASRKERHWSSCLIDARREKQGQLENKALGHVSPPDRAGINKSASHEGERKLQVLAFFLL